MTKSITGYPIIDEILESVAPSTEQPASAAGSIAFTDGTLRDVSNTNQLAPAPTAQETGEWRVTVRKPESPAEAVERIRRSDPEWVKLDSSAEVSTFENEEWRTERRADFNGYVAVRTTGGRPVAMGCRPEDAAQIVRDHNEHQSLSAERERLRAALQKFVDAYTGNKAAWLGNGQARRSLDEFRTLLLNEQGKELG